MNNTLELPGYRLIEPIYQRSKTLIYRGERSNDQKRVILKLLKKEYPNFQELLQFRHQYTIAKHLNLPGIVQPICLLNYRNSLVLVMEDDGSVSLKDYTHKTQLSLSEFLSIAIEITKILQGLYCHRIIHKDIKPSNILINPSTLQVKLIDFSLASLLPKENQEIYNPNVLEGTLTYMSPEQTGRMNRGIDYRTDFYSLGVTFYELLTRQLPFQATDPMELVHCHLAQKPTPPMELNPAIGVMVNNLVMKLMAKTPEERYQSALGLKYDLERCLEEWETSGKITTFELGVRDICDRFVIPEKLYGRETEVVTLLAAFDRVSSGSTEMILVAGFSGIGKTAVVNEVHKPIVRQRGYFIRGKFEQLQCNIPFSAFVQAFRNLLEQLLTETDAQIRQWKTKIIGAVGENGQVIIDMIPEVELLIGKQPPVPKLSPAAAQNRFNLLCEKFIRVFTSAEHPLVIFLDDLQWADSASLKLIKLLMSDVDTPYLLLIGAYRDNEVSAAHPLMLTLEEIKKAGVRSQESGVRRQKVGKVKFSTLHPLPYKVKSLVHTITIKPLQKIDLNQLIADTLSCSFELALPLTEFVYQKTKGNPFFSNQFLKVLHEDGLISFNLEAGYWQCDIAQVKAMAITEDVVEFMALKLQKLPQETQEVLKLAACIGNQFELENLAIVQEKSPTQTATDLWQALQEGLILPQSEVYKFFPAPRDLVEDSLQFPIPNSQFPTPYRFLHDRVQQAAYYLIPEPQKQATHLKIGQLLLKHTLPRELEDNIFEIVNQLNLGVELITSREEKNQLAQLNLIAGNKAKAATAAAAALRYLTVGMGLLTVNSWQHQYELTLGLYESAAEAAYLSGEFEQMEGLVNTLLQQAKTLLDKVKVYEVKIQADIAKHQQLTAVETGLEVLKLLGINFPEAPNPQHIELELQELQTALVGTKIEDLVQLPLMAQPDKLAAMRILPILSSAVYVAVPALYPLIVFKQVKLSLEYGNTAASAFAYATYGLILCAMAGDIDAGYQFGKLALSVLDKLNAKEIKCRTLVMVHTFISHCQEPVKETLKPLLEAYSSGLETGDLEFTALATFAYSYHSFFLGKELKTMEKEMAAYSKLMRQLCQETALDWNELFRQTVLNLQGCSENPCRLSGDSYDEDIKLLRHQSASDRTGLYYLYLNKLILCYLFGDYPQAIANAQAAEQYLDGVTGSLLVTLFYFYHSLSYLAVYPEAAQLEQESILEQITANQKKMKQWVDYAPMNHLQKFYLVEAELNRVLGKKLEAMDYYERAIASAKEYQYLQEEALANELAAKFYLAWGKQTIAQAYLINAYYSYARWGAKAKVEDLEAHYPQLLTPILNQEINYSTSPTPDSIISRKVTSSSSSSSSAVLDLATVMKASQAISGEIHLEKLLSILMEVLMENAGAEKGALILPSMLRSGQEGSHLFIAAQCIKAQECYLSYTPVASTKELPVSIINYVWRTSETIVVNDATAETTFAADPYIIKQEPKSVLCIPIVNQGKLIGILYLENNLTKGVFSSNRLAVLRILTSQVAISLENARLYSNLETANQKLEEYSRILEEKVEQRTKELKAAQKQIIVQEKLASLGSLTAGIAHELRNPLNFVNNYAIGSVELIEDLLAELDYQPKNLDSKAVEDLPERLMEIQENVTLITQHGQRIDSIIQNMLMHARHESNKKELTNLNFLLTQAIELVYHSKRAQETCFNITIETDFDEKIKPLDIVTQDISRAVINLLDNACYALRAKQQEMGADFKPMLSVKTRQLRETVEIRIRDNGLGILPELQEKIFHPFFTTKPTGEGTGLGLSLTYDIIVEQHGGTLKVVSEPGVYTEFIINFLNSN